MILDLSARGVLTRGFASEKGRVILRLRERTSSDGASGPADCVFVRDQATSPYASTIALPQSRRADFDDLPLGVRAVLVPEALAYLGTGDIIALDPNRGTLRVLYRANSLSNSLLITERCNHYCLMCSQPPRDIDDSYIFDELDTAVPLIDRDTREIGLTGGEPTLGGERFLALLRALKKHLPQTSVHILSNGRAFIDQDFVDAYASVDHKDLMVGIPIYADNASLHNYIVQSVGAFDETIRGILNLKASGSRVELRVVILKQNYHRLPQIAEFFARNLAFIDHVALMALEVTGFARANLDKIWIDPYDYREKLRDAALWLEASGMRVSIYNHQLCTLSPSVWHLARKSISDWKNEYVPECESCSVRGRCGGFFATGRTRRSAHLKAVLEAASDGLACGLRPY